MTDTNHCSYVNKPSSELVAALCRDAEVGSQKHEEIKGALQAVLVKDLTDSIDKHERAASRLSNQLLILNIILGLFTIVGAVLAVFQFLPKK